MPKIKLQTCTLINKIGFTERHIKYIGQEIRAHINMEFDIRKQYLIFIFLL